MIDLVTTAEESAAKYSEALAELQNKAYQMLYSEFVACWMKSPSCLVQTPGFAQNGKTVAWVVSDHFAGPGGEEDEVEMLSIIAAAAKEQTPTGERARKLIDRIARAHAEFHNHDAM